MGKMRVEFTGKGVEITPALKSFTYNKLRKIKKFQNDIEQVEIKLSIEKHRQKAEIIIKAKYNILSGTEETDDMYSSIGLALNKIERQARKFREKIRDNKRRKRER